MSATVKTVTATALAAAVATAMASFSAFAAPPDDTRMKMATGGFEMCYGVALAGQNDCAGAGHSCAGHQTVDYDPTSFKLVAKGTCTAMTTPKGMGSLTPM